MTNKQKVRLALILIVGALILVVAYALINTFAHQNRKYSLATYNLQDSWVQNNDIYYYTGSFFAKYDTGDNSIKRLSDYLFINSGINFVTWSQQAVIFQASPQQSDRDDITVAARELGVNPYVTHWWRYDFATKQYQLLDFSGIDKCQTLTQLSSNLLGCIRPGELGDTSSDVSIFDLNKKTARKITSSNNVIQDLVLSKNTLFYTVTSLGGNQSLNSVNTSSGANQTIYSSKGLVKSYLPLDANKVLLNEVALGKSSSSDSHGHDSDEESSNNLSQKLILLQNKEKMFDKKLDSNPVNLYKIQDQAFVSSRNGSINKIVNNKLVKVSGSTRKPLSDGAFLFKVDDKFFVINASGDLLSSPSFSRKGIRKPDSFVSGKDNDAKGRSWIDFSQGGARNVFLFSNKIPSSQQQLSVGSLLEKNGFRPSEFNLQWVADGVDFHAPIEPRAIIIK